MVTKSLIFEATAGLMIGGLMPSVPAYAKSPAVISIIGAGPAGGSTQTSCTNSDDALCPSGVSNCWCNTANGTAKTALGGLGAATFSADSVIIESSSNPFFIGSCNNASGKVTITSGNHKNSLVLTYSGVACFIGSILTGGPVVINMSYAVDSSHSTGKLAGATGVGLITGSEQTLTGDILGNVNGNILFP